MTTDNTTICAISTPPGIGGIAVARISGPHAIDITDSIWQGQPLAGASSHTAHLGTIVDTDGKMLDQAVATVYRAPRSFTGEDTVELSIHGSAYIQRRLIETLISAGCALAQPGEFTRRAFTAGKMDLAEAEAIADVIASNSRAAHRIAVTQMKGAYSRRLNELRAQLLDLAALLELELDFSEEDVEFASRENLRKIAHDIHTEVTRLHSSFAAGQAIKDGIPVAIVGATNAGKSSLLNTLIGDDRAIVSDIHGTTRDTIEETLETGDYLFRFIDTAGLRETDDTIERIGIQRTRQAIDRAMITLLVIDPASIPDKGIIENTLPTDPTRHLIIAINKTDLHSPADIEATIAALPSPTSQINLKPIDTHTREGIAKLR
ncbi:MAG: tRNA uridine-5-carboxymethylaminomethyl(34) synthesis GTPase MnmE [Duncaniella sp.]|nr:tRNA uridine-5-carboxymethylaminomethyl(34) synthesis GTPase MnmE [Duncaniella sp.]